MKCNRRCTAPNYFRASYWRLQRSKREIVAKPLMERQEFFADEFSKTPLKNAGGIPISSTSALL
jgi:hypothetical protein